jgi:hypothetical protein
LNRVIVLQLSIVDLTAANDKSPTVFSGTILAVAQARKTASFDTQLFGNSLSAKKYISDFRLLDRNEMTAVVASIVSSIKLFSTTSINPPPSTPRWPL